MPLPPPPNSRTPPALEGAHKGLPAYISGEDMGRLLAGLAPELSLLVSEGKDGTVSSSAGRAGRTTSATRQPAGQRATAGRTRPPLHALEALGLCAPPSRSGPGLEPGGPACPPSSASRELGPPRPALPSGLRPPPPGLLLRVLAAPSPPPTAPESFLQTHRCGKVPPPSNPRL